MRLKLVSPDPHGICQPLPGRAAGRGRKVFILNYNSAWHVNSLSFSKTGSSFKCSFGAEWRVFIQTPITHARSVRWVVQAKRHEGMNGWHQWYPVSSWNTAPFCNTHFPSDRVNEWRHRDEEDTTSRIQLQLCGSEEITKALTDSSLVLVLESCCTSGCTAEQRQKSSTTYCIIGKI